MKVIVYTIAKNESAFVERFCESAKDADDIVIVDTGSDDGTAGLAKRCGATTYEVCVSPWRFDVARNASLALVPGDADVCVCLDLDEVMEPGWRDEVEARWSPDTTRLRYMFDWGDGVRFMSDKVHSRRGYLWKHPCHERLVSDPRVVEKFSETPRLLVRHLPDQTKSRGQYLDILRVGTLEDPHDARNSFYYARELTFYSMWAAAIEELRRYLSLPSATWGAERGYAARLIGRCLESLGRPVEAEEWYVVATREAPERRDSWLELADYYHRIERWQDCLPAAKKALEIVDFRSDWPVDPAAWGSKPHDLVALASYYTGDKAHAISHGTIASAMEPGNPRLVENLRWYKGERN